MNRNTTRQRISIWLVFIAQSERKYHWPLGPRLADHHGLSALGL